MMENTEKLQKRLWKAAGQLIANSKLTWPRNTLKLEDSEVERGLWDHEHAAGSIKNYLDIGGVSLRVFMTYGCQMIAGGLRARAR